MGLPAVNEHLPFKDIANIDPIQDVYAAKRLNKKELLKETSGGIFGVLAEEIIKNNGVVFGCAWNDKMVAQHIEVSNIIDLRKLYGSKYVQSDTLDTYKRVKHYLIEGKKVLYSGTGCQIAGLRAFLYKEYENLITVDVICHGVPSPLLFKKYLEWQSGLMGAPITAYDFRNKEKTVWGSAYKAKIGTDSKNKYVTSNLDPYFSSFIKGETYRHFCYSCKFANVKRISDITLGDYWGINKQHPEFSDHKGVSVIVVNTGKGKFFLVKTGTEITTVSSTYQQAALQNKSLLQPTSLPVIRDSIYDNICNIGLSELFEQRLLINKTVVGVLKNAIPKSVYVISAFAKKCMRLLRR